MATTKVTISFELEVDREAGEYPEQVLVDKLELVDRSFGAYLNDRIIHALYAGYASIMDTNGNKIGMVEVKTR